MSDRRWTHAALAKSPSTRCCGWSGPSSSSRSVMSIRNFRLPQRRISKRNRSIDALSDQCASSPTMTTVSLRARKALSTATKSLSRRVVGANSGSPSIPSAGAMSSSGPNGPGVESASQDARMIWALSPIRTELVDKCRLPHTRFATDQHDATVTSVISWPVATPGHRQRSERHRRRLDQRGRRVTVDQKPIE